MHCAECVCVLLQARRSAVCWVWLQVITVLHAKPAFFWTLLVNSCMAYAVNLTNFMVTKYTSALTLQVRGARAVGVSLPTAWHCCRVVRVSAAGFLSSLKTAGWCPTVCMYVQHPKRYSTCWPACCAVVLPCRCLAT